MRHPSILCFGWQTKENCTMERAVLLAVVLCIFFEGTWAAYCKTGFTYTYCSYGCCGTYSSYCCSSSSYYSYSSYATVNVGLIVGAVIGGIVGLIFLIVIIVVICKACTKSGSTGRVVRPANFVMTTQTHSNVGAQQGYANQGYTNQGYTNQGYPSSQTGIVAPPYSGNPPNYPYPGPIQPQGPSTGSSLYPPEQGVTPTVSSKQ